MDGMKKLSLHNVNIPGSTGRVPLYCTSVIKVNGLSLFTLCDVLLNSPHLALAAEGMEAIQLLLIKGLGVIFRGTCSHEVDQEYS